MIQRLTRHKIFAFSILSAGFFAILLSGRAAALSGSSFRADSIIDDSIFFNSGAMNAAQIQTFLNAKVPVCDTNGTAPSGISGYATEADYGNANGYPPPYICLKDYSQSITSLSADAYCNAIPGGTFSAAQMIAIVSQACGINPQDILVMLQKEQGLVSDSWPFPSQYRIAMGYGCPDTAACDSAYYGFFNQIYNAARQLQRYVKVSGYFNYRVGQSSYILYNPNTSCGGSNITILTRATAALYNYTPYQPNAAALNNLYGRGDSCSAYGNRNFWRMFNDWFGTTQGQSYALVKPNGDTTQYILCNQTLYSVGSLEMLLAWGLDKMGAATDIDPAYIGSLPRGDTLSRLVRPDGDWALYVVDGGNKWVVPSAAALGAWGLGSTAQSNIPGVVANALQMQGALGYIVRQSGDSMQYMMDGGTLRSYANVDILKAWEGDTPPSAAVLSSQYFSEFTAGTALSGFKFSYNGGNYLAAAGRRLTMNSDVDALYNFPIDAVSKATYDRLTDGGAATYLVSSDNQQNVYLVDNGQKRPISLDLAAAYSPGGTISSTAISAGSLNLMPSAAAITTVVAKQGSQYYLIDGKKTPIPTNLVAAYIGSNSLADTNIHILNLMSSSSTLATQFIRSSSDATVYALDDGRTRSLSNLTNFVLWGGDVSGVTVVSPAALRQFTNALPLGNYISNQGTNYVVQSGLRMSVDAAAQTNWGLTQPQAVGDSVISYLSDGGALPSAVHVGSSYLLVRNGVAFETNNLDMASIWKISNAPSISNLMLIGLPHKPLSRFARSADPSDKTIYVTDYNAFYAVSSVPAVFNLGYGGELMPVLDANELSTRGKVFGWDNVLGQDAAGTYYIFDGGVKRRFADSAAQSQWTNNGAVTAQTFSNSFLNLLITNNNAMTKSFRASEPTVYAVVGGVKHWIQSPYTVLASYAPSIIVSTLLRDSLPSGTPIP